MKRRFFCIGLLAAIVVCVGIIEASAQDAATTRGRRGDGNLTVIYDPASGELSYDSDNNVINLVLIQSAASVFDSAVDAAVPGSGNWTDLDNLISGSTIGAASIDSVWSFGNVARSGLTEPFLLEDLTITFTKTGQGGQFLGNLFVVPEPSTLLLLGMAGIGLLLWRRR